MSRRRAFNYFKAAFSSLFGAGFILLGLLMLAEPELGFGSRASLAVVGLASGPVVGALIASRVSDVRLYWVILLGFMLGAIGLGMGLKLPT